MRAVVVRCPNCNANLQVSGTEPSTTCSYCGTVARIQTRSMMFQIPKAPTLPPVSPQQSESERRALVEQFARMPVAMQRVSKLAVIIPTAAILLVVSFGIYAAVKASRAVVEGTSAAERARWAGIPPVLADVDHDGVPDLVGLVRYLQPEDRVMLAAFSGKTGARLWEGTSLGTFSGSIQYRFASMGDVVYAITDTGGLAARDLAKQGAVRWDLAFGEKIDLACARGTEIVVVTADDKWWVVDAAGKKRESPPLHRLDREYANEGTLERFENVGPEAGDTCVPIAWHHGPPAGMLAMRVWGDAPKAEGLRIDLLLRWPGKPAIAIGSKSPGTAVPMLARFSPSTDPPAGSPPRTPRGTQLLWKVEVPAVDPLKARLDTQHVVLDDTTVYALYEVSDRKLHLAAFELETGARRWDREVASGSDIVPVALSRVPDGVALTTWGDVTVYAAANGADRYRIP